MYKMWKQLPKLQFINQFCVRITKYRTFLSQGFNCTEEWNSRLDQSLFQHINVEKLYYELDEKFTDFGKVSAIDVDILANKITDSDHIEELADILHRLRMTDETTYTLKSTSHAVIRNLLDHNKIEQLIYILDNRLDYGIFFDDYTANLTLDKLIKSNDFKSASRIATILMLQENFENPITKYLSLYSCYAFLKNPPEIMALDDKEVKASDADGAAKITTTGKKGKKPEEIKVRVKFLRNPYFDDHFDLKLENHLIGKTLLLIGERLTTTDPSTTTTMLSLGQSLQLLGYCLYDKYSNANEFLAGLQQDQKFHKEIITMINEHLVKAKDIHTDNEAFNEISDSIIKLQSSPTLLDDNVLDVIQKLAQEAVAENESKEIDLMKMTYNEWCEQRIIKLNEELERLKRAQRLREIKQITKDMVVEEQKLWFFENEEKIDLEIESKQLNKPKQSFGRTSKVQAADISYIPPEIRSNRNK